MKSHFNNHYESIILDEKNKFGSAFKNALTAGLIASAPLSNDTAEAQSTNQVSSISHHNSFSSSVSNKNTPRGIRNNNPGNIEKSSISWDGAVSDDGRFLQFASMEWGIRAMFRILRTYEESYKRDTIEKIIYRYAPPEENDTEKYIKTVSEISGLKRNEKIKQGSLNQIKLVHAMIIMENGRKGEIDKHTIGRGLSLINQTYRSN